ncbi:MAG: hypothetical protein ACOYL5_20550, partial [Phototrophicaceae bacterium]
MDIDKRLFDEITAFFAKHISHNLSERPLQIEPHLMDCPKATVGLDYSGDNQTFAQRLVSKLQVFSMCDSGEYALVLLLARMAANLGVDVQKEAAGYIARLNGKPSDPDLQAGGLVCGCTLVRQLGKGGNGE